MTAPRQLNLRLSPSEHAVLVDLAKLYGISVSALVRRLATEDKVVITPHVCRDQWVALAPVVSNLNQAVRQLNAAKGTVPAELWEALHSALIETQGHLVSIRAALLP